MTDELEPPEWLTADDPPPREEYSPELLAHAAEACARRPSPPARLASPRGVNSRGTLQRFDAEYWLQRHMDRMQRPAPPPTRVALTEHERARAMDGLPAWLARIGCPLDLRETRLEAELVPSVLRSWSTGFPHAKCHALITGPTSRGKSGAALWLLQEFYIRSIGSDRWPPRAMWVYCHDLYQHVFQKHYDKLEQIRTTHMLVLDDMGAVFEHDWPLATMDALIEQRHQARRPCIVTTNLPPTVLHARASKQPENKTIEGRYPRAYGRLVDKRGPGIVRMAGPDLRSGERPARPHT